MAVEVEMSLPEAAAGRRSVRPGAASRAWVRALPPTRGGGRPAGEVCL